MTRRRILVVDDDPQIRDLLRIALTRAGFAVAEAADGATALDAALATAGQQAPDLIVLDIGLPEVDGREVCRRLRRDSDVPVIFLTAESDEVERVVGLEIGADDYVTKPFSPRELVARINAVLKRAAPDPSASPEADPVRDAPLRQGRLSADPGRHRVTADDRPVAVTSREMDLLVRLMSRPDQVLPRPQLVDAIWGTNVNVSDRTVDSHLRNLRAKLSEAGLPDAIETVHGVGIRMGPCRGG